MCSGEKDSLTDRFRDQLRQDVFLVMLWNRSDDGRKGWHVGELMLLGHFCSQAVEIDILLRHRCILLGFVFLDQETGNV